MVTARLVGCNVDLPSFAEDPELFYVGGGLPWHDFEREVSLLIQITHLSD